MSMLKKTGIVSLVMVVVGLSLAGLLTASAVDNGDKQMKEAASVGSSLEVHITNNGKTLVRGARVSAVNGNTITASTGWGSANLNWNIVTDSDTKFVRRFGGASQLSEVSVGDFISFQGSLDTNTASPLTVRARVVKDWSVQKTHLTLKGSVSSVTSSTQSFVLATQDRGNVAVYTSSSTKFYKGSNAATFADLAVGETVSAQGLYNSQLNRLDAEQVKIHLAGTKQTTVEGKAKTAPSNTAPTTFVLTADGKDYTVKVAVDTSILNNKWLKISLGRISVGDKVRVYGLVNPDMTIDATVLRDTSVK